MSPSWRSTCPTRLPSPCAWPVAVRSATLTLPLETRGQSLIDSVGGAAEDHARLLREATGRGRGRGGYRGAQLHS